MCGGWMRVDLYTNRPVFWCGKICVVASWYWPWAVCWRYVVAAYVYAA
jgi:hypothetical protein